MLEVAHLWELSMFSPNWQAHYISQVGRNKMQIIFVFASAYNRSLGLFWYFICINRENFPILCSGSENTFNVIFTFSCLTVSQCPVSFLSLTHTHPGVFLHACAYVTHRSPLQPQKPSALCTNMDSNMMDWVYSGLTRARLIPMWPLLQRELGIPWVHL